MARKGQHDPDKHQFWQAHLDAWRRSGLAVRAYCRQHRLSEHSFYAWRRTLDQRQPASTPTNAATTTPDRTASPFIPVRLIDQPADQPANDPVLEIVLRGGRLLRVPPGFPADDLRRVVATLENLSC